MRTAVQIRRPVADAQLPNYWDNRWKRKKSLQRRYLLGRFNVFRNFQYYKYFTVSHQSSSLPYNTMLYVTVSTVIHHNGLEKVYFLKKKILPTLCFNHRLYRLQFKLNCMEISQILKEPYFYLTNNIQLPLRLGKDVKKPPPVLHRSHSIICPPYLLLPPHDSTVETTLTLSVNTARRGKRCLPPQAAPRWSLVPDIKSQRLGGWGRLCEATDWSTGADVGVQSGEEWKTFSLEVMNADPGHKVDPA